MWRTYSYIYTETSNNLLTVLPALFLLESCPDRDYFFIDENGSLQDSITIAYADGAIQELSITDTLTQQTCNYTIRVFPSDCSANFACLDTFEVTINNASPRDTVFPQDLISAPCLEMPYVIFREGLKFELPLNQNTTEAFAVEVGAIDFAQRCSTNIKINNSYDCIQLDCKDQLDIIVPLDSVTVYPEAFLNLFCEDNTYFLRDSNGMRLDSFTVFLDEIYQDSLEVVDSVSGNSCIVPFTVNEQLNCTFSCNDLTFIGPASDFEPLFFELSDVMDTVCFGEYQISGASIQAGPILNGVQTYALPPTINTPAEVTISNTSSGQSCTFQLNIVDFPSAIKGQVFIDEDGMCDWDTLTEVISLSNILIRVVEPVLEDTFYTVTDFDGKYQINLPFGDYEVEALSPDDTRWSMCGTTFISIGQDTILEGVNHVLKPEEFCYYPEVNVSGSFLRRCFDRVISVRYANNGSILMPDATVEIMLPADLSITDASRPFTDEGSNRYVFEVGDLDPGENGVFFLTLFTACNDDVILGENFCIEARMFPLSDCDLIDNYSGANLDVKGSCIGDSVVFEIENLGPGDMLVPYEFIVIEDEILRTRQNVDLVAGQMEQLTYEANGAAFTIVTEQVVENPFSRQISSFVETCTSSSSQLISLGFGNMFPQTDEEPNLSIECLEVRGSFDPNDKMEPLLEYQILEILQKL